MSESTRLRAILKGDVADVRVQIEHPMETGLRKNSRGDLVPLHFVSRLTASHNGRVVFEAHLSQGVSRNPLLGFQVRGAKNADTISVSWVDNQGNTGNASTTVKAG